VPHISCRFYGIPINPSTALLVFLSSIAYDIGLASLFPTFCPMASSGSAVYVSFIVSFTTQWTYRLYSLNASRQPFVTTESSLQPIIEFLCHHIIMLDLPFARQDHPRSHKQRSITGSVFNACHTYIAR
jgi:hypothetical protein